MYLNKYFSLKNKKKYLKCIFKNTKKNQTKQKNTQIVFKQTFYKV